MGVRVKPAEITYMAYKGDEKGEITAALAGRELTIYENASGHLMIDQSSGFYRYEPTEIWPHQTIIIPSRGPLRIAEIDSIFEREWVELPGEWEAEWDQNLAKEKEMEALKQVIRDEIYSELEQYGIL